MALNDPGLKQLIESVEPCSALETLRSEFIGGQPGNYAYQAWQVADWSPDWAAVYGVSDGGREEGYPFPWLLGFCRKDRLERNFIELLRHAGDRFDRGFYCTYGAVSGHWRLARVALTASIGFEGPQWEIIDDLLLLDESLRDAILEDSQEVEYFLSRIIEIKNGAYDAGFEDDITLAELLEKAGGHGSLESIEEQLPGLGAASIKCRSRKRRGSESGFCDRSRQQ